MNVFKAFPDAYRWRCGKCSRWNDIEKEQCGKCKSAQADWADAFRIKNQLTPEELNYYRHQVPLMLKELREINIRLGGASPRGGVNEVHTTSQGGTESKPGGADRA